MAKKNPGLLGKAKGRPRPNKNGLPGLLRGLPPDVRDAIRAQIGVNASTASTNDLLNRPNESNIYGGVNYSTDPTTGRTVRTETLNPWEQRKYQDQTYNELERNKIMGDKLMKQVSDAYSNPLDYSGIEQLPGQGDRFGYQREVADDVYNDFLNQNKATWGQEDQDFRQRLAEQGIPEGSAEYDRRYRQMMQGREQAMKSMQTQARLTGAGLAQNAFDQALASRNQGISEKNYLRSRPAEEMAHLLSMNTGVANPQFTPFAPVTMQGTDVTGTWAANKGFQTQKDITAMNNATTLEAANIGAQNNIDVQNIRNEGANSLQNSAQNYQDSSRPSWGQGLIQAGTNAAVTAATNNIFDNFFKSRPTTQQRSGPGVFTKYGNTF